MNPSTPSTATASVGPTQTGLTAAHASNASSSEAQRRATRADAWLWYGALLTGGLLCALLLAAVATQQRPFPAVTLSADGWRLEGQTDRIFDRLKIDEVVHPIDPAWLLESPGHARDVTQLIRMYVGETILQRAPDAADVSAVATDGARVQLTFAQRGIADVGPRFWIPFLSGLTVYGFALLAIRTGGAQWEAFFLWLAATGYFVAIGLHGWHSDRPWAGDESVWGIARWGIVVGSSLSTWCIVALLWVAPTKIGNPFYAAVVCILIALGDKLAVELHGTAAPHRWVLGMSLVALIALFVVQWQRSRRADAIVARVALRWSVFALVPGIVVAITIWTGFVSETTLPRWNNLALTAYGVLMIGMSALVVRHRLYVIEDWYRPALAALLSVMVAFLVMGLGFAGWRTVSIPLVLGAVLAAVLTLWAILRGFRSLGRGHPPIDTHALLPDLLRVAQANADARGELWLALLRRTFVCDGLAPNGIAAPQTPPDTVEIATVLNSGASLQVAAAADALPSLELSGARNGLDLFTPNDAATVTLLHTLLQQAITANDAFRSGAHTERKRIAADLHDDIGGRLLSLSQRLSAPKEARYVRDALADLRTMTHALGGENFTWGERLADLRWDLTERARSGGATLNWQVQIERTVLDSKARTEASVSLGAIGSELLRNAIEHSVPREIGFSITLKDSHWQLVFHHPSTGSTRPWSAGFGMNSIRRRVSELGGSCEWRSYEANEESALSTGPFGEASTVFTAQLPHENMIEN